MSETIFRVEKNAENPYVMIDKNVFEDTSLSFKAKGILGYLLSRPNDWTLIIADIQKRSTDGKDSVKNGIDELIERGYIVKTEQPRQAGKFATCDYVVYEKPINTGANRCGKTVAAKPSRINRHGKSATTNNNKLNNELLKKDINSGDGKKPKKQKTTTLPNDLEITQAQIEKCKSYGLDAHSLFDNFKNHHGAKGSEFANWSMAFNTWINNEIKFNNLQPVEVKQPVTAAPVTQSDIRQVSPFEKLMGGA